MTPATNAIVASLPREKQGVASAVNDTARELGAAFGVAMLGSAFNIGYRDDIADNLGGFAADAAERAPTRRRPSGCRSPHARRRRRPAPAIAETRSWRGCAGRRCSGH